MHVLESDDAEKERRFVRSASGWRPAGEKTPHGKGSAASFKVRKKPDPLDGGVVFYAYLRGFSADGRPYAEKYDFEFDGPFCKVYRSGRFANETLDFYSVESNDALECVRIDGEDFPKDIRFRAIYEHILKKLIGLEMPEAERAALCGGF